MQNQTQKPKNKFNFYNTTIAGNPEINSLPNLNINPNNNITNKPKSHSNFKSDSLRNTSNYKRFQNLNIFSTYDTDKLKDQILKLKLENNKKENEINLMKTEIYKLEEDNKKNINIIEKILNETGKSATEIINSLVNREENINNEFLSQNSNNLNNLKDINLSPKNFIRLKEVYVIAYLKKQILQMKHLLLNKEEEIENLKINSRVINFSKMEYNFTNTFNEMDNFKKGYEKLKFSHDENSKILKEITEEKEHFRNMMIKFKTQFEDAKGKLKILENENLNLSEGKKINDEKFLYMNKTFFNKQSVLKEKEKEIKTKFEDGNKLNEIVIENKKLKENYNKLKKTSDEMIKKMKEDMQSKYDKMMNYLSNLEKENTNFKKDKNNFKNKNNSNSSRDMTKLLELENSLLLSNNKIAILNCENENLKNKVLELEQINDDLKVKNQVGNNLIKEVGNNLKNEDVNNLKNEVGNNLKNEVGNNLKNEVVNNLKNEVSNNLKNEVVINLKNEVVNNLKIDNNLNNNTPKKVTLLNQQSDDNFKNKFKSIPAEKEEINKGFASSDDDDDEEDEFELNKKGSAEHIIKTIFKSDFNIDSDFNINSGLTIKESLSKINEEKKSKSSLFKTAPEIEIINKNENINTNTEDDNNNVNNSKNFNNNENKYNLKNNVSNQNEQNELIISSNNKKSSKLIFDKYEIKTNDKSSINKINTTTYLIQVCESEPQEINPKEHFFVRNTDTEIIRRKKCSTLVVNKKPILRTPTMDRVITEKISNNMNFEDLIKDIL